jgi:hypothetical protein
MSSPVHTDVDKRFMYAPPWARETPQQPPQAIVAAIERLRLERLRTAGPSPDDAAGDSQHQQEADLDQPELPLGERTNPMDIEGAMADAVRAAWSPPSLEPVVMPVPPKPRLGGPTWGMFARLASAVGFAAAVALFVTGAVPFPTIDISLHASDGAKAASSFVQAFGRRELSEPKSAPIVVAAASPAMPLSASMPVPSAPPTVAPPPPPPSPPASASLPSEVLSAFASIDTAPRLPGSKADMQMAAVASAANVADHHALDRDELAGLLKRGQALLAEGDISSARLLLRRAAEASDGAAALTLAGTYDRAELAKLKVIGVAHDHAQAKVWYTRAVANGSAEAVRRLQQLAQRAD